VACVGGIAAFDRLSWRATRRNFFYGRFGHLVGDRSAGSAARTSARDNLAVLYH
jgi:hypothetical protein